MLRILILAGILAAAFSAVPAMLERQLAPTAGDTEPASRETAARPETGQAQPATAAPTSHQGGRKMQLAATAGGHFSAEFRLNGRRVPAMIDTGATHIAINRTTARRIGLSVAEADFTGSAETANGRARFAPVVIERIALGRIELDDVQAVVLDDQALSGTLVGMSFLSRLKRYSVEDGMLVLEQ
ncbi:MAG: TIGR02281 family clan AA aspartic protease [Aquamicrobium sp.]|uniref:TIGR02281 family clan AA aspartic protease n=1 Tax=Aquamicrobium sp. TaxID=1872579 RepID=UPI00349ED36C|nr:TIGR02281 family clan AA aspartic protease [Aquamicrobium sp.]